MGLDALHTIRLDPSHGFLVFFELPSLPLHLAEETVLYLLLSRRSLILWNTSFSVLSEYNQSQIQPKMLFVRLAAKPSVRQCIQVCRSHFLIRVGGFHRSEERRVGKEST